MAEGAARWARGDGLDGYVAAWGLEGPRLLRETYTSRVYTVLRGGETCVLKLLAPGEVEEQRGAAALRWFGGRGAVRLLEADEGAQLLEYAPGEELAARVMRGEDLAATRVIGEVLGELHSAPPPDGHVEGLLGLDQWFGALLARGAADRRAGRDSVYVRGAAVAEGLLREPREVRVLHGDIHHYNIRQAARGWLAYDPKGLVGERAYDCANALCNPVLPELVFDGARLLRNAGILAEMLGLERARVLAFTYAYACLNASQWLALGGGEMMEWSLRVAGVVEEVRGSYW